MYGKTCFRNKRIQFFIFYSFISTFFTPNKEWIKRQLTLILLHSSYIFVIKSILRLIFSEADWYLIKENYEFTIYHVFVRIYARNDQSEQDERAYTYFQVVRRIHRFPTNTRYIVLAQRQSHFSASQANSKYDENRNERSRIPTKRSWSTSEKLVASNRQRDGEKEGELQFAQINSRWDRNVVGHNGSEFSFDKNRSLAIKD